MTNWKVLIEPWQEQYGCKTFTPVTHDLLTQTVETLNLLPEDLVSLYNYSNGLLLEWFRILPVRNPSDLKHTWDDLNSANSPEKTRFLGGDVDLLQRFLIFATLDSGNCAVVDRTDASIWYEEDGELQQTDFTISQFVESCLKEVTEL